MATSPQDAVCQMKDSAAQQMEFMLHFASGTDNMRSSRSIVDIEEVQGRTLCMKDGVSGCRVPICQ